MGCGYRPTLQEDWSRRHPRGLARATPGLPTSDRPTDDVARKVTCPLAMSCKASILVAAAALAAFAHGKSAELSCGECTAIQESIYRSIRHNLTDLEQKAMAGTTMTKTIEIGQIIWHVCESEAWKGARYQPSLYKACKSFVKSHVDLTTNYWKEKASEEYKDAALALRMKRAVCSNPEVGACELDSLPSAYRPLRADECAVCYAVVSGIFGVVAYSRDRPTEGKRSDAYYRLQSQISSVCAELPMRHAIREGEGDAINELCEDLWDEHEATLAKLALRRDDDFAMRLCADELEICDDPMSKVHLYAHDPEAAEAYKVEL